MTTKDMHLKCATLSQRQKIRAMLDGDKFSFDLASAIIDQRIQIISVDDKRIAYWEKKYPNKGAELMEIMRPFYCWRQELKPVLPDLKDRMNKVFFWEKSFDVKPFYLSQAGSTDSLLKVFFGTSFANSSKFLFTLKIRKSLATSLRVTFGRRLIDLSNCSLVPDGETLALWRWVQNFIKESLITAGALILANKSQEAARVALLFDVLRAGNFPVGFDKDGNLVVLVAE